MTSFAALMTEEEDRNISKLFKERIDLIQDSIFSDMEKLKINKQNPFDCIMPHATNVVKGQKSYYNFFIPQSCESPLFGQLLLTINENIIIKELGMDRIKY